MRHRTLATSHIGRAFVALMAACFVVAVGLMRYPAAAQIPTISTVGYGQTIPGEVTASSGTEHHFTGCADETVGVTVTANDFAPRVEIYFGGEATALASATAPAGERTVFIEGIDLPKSGAYTVVVSGRSRADRGGYSVSLEGSGPENPLPDDGNRAIDLSYGDSVTGTIVPENGDQWSFRGCTGDVVTVDLVAAGFTPQIELLVEIAEFPLAKMTGDTANGGATLTVLRHTLPANGVYNISVSSTSPDEAGNYALTLALEGQGAPTPTMTLAPEDTPTPTATATAPPTMIPSMTATQAATTTGTARATTTAQATTAQATLTGQPAGTAAATATGTGPRGRRGVPTRGASATPGAPPTVTSTVTRAAPPATPTPTSEFIMPGAGESAFTVIDISRAGGPANHVAYSPDGTLFASAHDDGAVRVWIRARGQLVQTLAGHAGRATYVAFAPNDEFIASAGDDGTVRLWDQVGRETAVLEMPSSGVTSVAFSPDSTMLVATTDDGDVVVWDVAADGSEASVRYDLPDHSAPVYAATFSPDGTLIASGGGAGIMRLSNAENGERVDGLPVNAGPGSGDPILSIAFSADGNAVVVGGVRGINNASVHVWDLTTGDPIRQLEGHTEWGSAATLSPNQAYIFSSGRNDPATDGAEEATARLWNAETGALAVAFVGYPSSVVAATFSPDGDELLTSDGRLVYLWPAEMLDALAATFGEAVGVQVPAQATSAATPVPSRAAPRATPAATPTPTAPPTLTPRPTATATLEPPVPGVTLDIFCTVTAERLNLRPGPGTNFTPPVDVLESGELIVVVGRNADSSWLQVAVLDVNLEVENTGWVSADFVFCVGEIDDAPVVDVQA